MNGWGYLPNEHKLIIFDQEKWYKIYFKKKTRGVENKNSIKIYFEKKSSKRVLNLSLPYCVVEIV